VHKFVQGPIHEYPLLPERVLRPVSLPAAESSSKGWEKGDRGEGRSGPSDS